MFQFFKHESEEGRMVHFLAVKYFLKNAGYHVSQSPNL